MSAPLKYHVEEWCRLALAQITGLTAFAFRHKAEESDAPDNVVMTDAPLGKRLMEGDRPYEGKLTVELRVRQDISIAAFHDAWAKIIAALASPVSANAAAYKLTNFPKGFLLKDEDADDDKEELSDNYRHISRTIPIEVEP